MPYLNPSLPAFLIASLLGTQVTAQDVRLREVHRMTPALTSRIRALAVIDADNDGDLDIFVANGRSKQNFLLRNNGHAYFTDLTAGLPQIMDSTMDVAAGDINGDGLHDLFLANAVLGPVPGIPASDPQDRLYLGTPEGGFLDATSQVSPDGTSTRACAMADFDGDGDLDVVTGNETRRMRLYLNDGSGNLLVESSAMPVEKPNVWDIEAGDVDQDGDLDLFVGIENSQNFLLLWDSTNQRFTNVFPTHLPADAGYCHGAAMGDADGDGDLDILVGNWNEDDQLLINNGSGIFSASQGRIPQHPYSSRDGEFFDRDGDGDLDILLSTTGGLYFYENDGTGTFSEQNSKLPYGGSANDIAIADLDGSGTLDLLFGGFNPYELDILLADSSGGYLSVAQQVPRNIGLSQTIASGDLDGDGSIDVVVGGVSGYASQALLNDGAGAFSPNSLPIPDSEGSRFAQLGDLDGDNDLDLVIASMDSAPGGPLKLYQLLNDGAGNFTITPGGPTLLVATGSTANNNEPGDLELADVDRDGDLDILLAMRYDDGTGSQAMRLFDNGGSGSFTDASSKVGTMGILGAHNFAVTDLTGDGWPDIALFPNRSNTLYLYHNDGTGGFPSAMSTVIFGGDYVDAGDLDGDGDSDLVTVRSTSIASLLNDGLGNFTSVVHASPIGNRFNVQLQDLDEDGDLDVLVPTNNSSTIPYTDSLLLNDGLGNWTEGELLGHTASNYQYAFGDFDGDGDMDAFPAQFSYGPAEPVLQNLTRHIAWHSVPGLGRTIGMQVHGPSNGFWAAYYSTGIANLLLPAFGVLRLEPTTLTPLGVGLLDAKGDAERSIVIPSDPTLIGQTIYMQGAVGVPGAIRLTNRDEMTIIDF